MEADISTWQKTGHFYFALTGWQHAGFVQIGGTSISFAEVHAIACYAGDWQIVAKVRALEAIYSLRLASIF